MIENGFWETLIQDRDRLFLYLTVLELLMIFGGLWYAGRQLKFARLSLLHTEKVHAESLVWNKKIAAQQALAEVKNATALEHLNTHFSYISRNLAVDGPIPLTEIKNGLDANPRLSSELFDLLNFYERLALGVNQNMYDEGVIRKGRRRAMAKAYGSFSEFILDRRAKQKSGAAWKEVGILINRWSAEGHLEGMSGPNA